jgi:hypothetical protein
VNRTSCRWLLSVSMDRSMDVPYVRHLAKDTYGGTIVPHHTPRNLGSFRHDSIRQDSISSTSSTHTHTHAVPFISLSTHITNNNAGGINHQPPNRGIIIQDQPKQKKIAPKSSIGDLFFFLLFSGYDPMPQWPHHSFDSARKLSSASNGEPLIHQPAS